MKLDLVSFSERLLVEDAAGTPSWGTALGQGVGHKLSFDGMHEILPSMIYCMIPNMNIVSCNLGKGGKNYQYGDPEIPQDIILASLFTNVYVNNKRIEDGVFLLLITKEHSTSHDGRFTLKYSLKATYNGIYINQDCCKKMLQTLGVSENAAWFVDEINMVDQDQLHFTTYVVNPHNAETYESIPERKRRLLELTHSYKGKIDVPVVNINPNELEKMPLQQILFGAPGTGKSHYIDKKIPKHFQIRTTFHPDSDYASFVGCYKPIMRKVSSHEEDPENQQTIKELTYEFSPQAFAKAYVRAWTDRKRPVFLIIEEINRGNCAQIFGDTFQLLDRNEDGFSVYPIDSDEELRKYLEEAFYKYDIKDSEIKSGAKICLPNNLYIWTTMNTSDQSLFPIDSAFKRRWHWKYIPIKDEGKKHYIEFYNGQRIDWWKFIEGINKKIYIITSSADKQIGYWFAIPDKEGEGGKLEISIEQFVSKVLFYLWNDVYKDYGDSKDSIFRVGDGDDDRISFADFYEGDDVNIAKVHEFLSFNGLLSKDYNLAIEDPEN